MKDKIEQIRAGELAIENDVSSDRMIEIIGFFWQEAPAIAACANFYFDKQGEWWDAEDVEMSTIKASELYDYLFGEKEWEPKFGEKVLAWCGKESDAIEVIYLGVDKTGVFPYLICIEQEYNSAGPECDWFENIKQIPEKTKVTLKEIAEWKGVSQDEIEIV